MPSSPRLPRLSGFQLDAACVAVLVVAVLLVYHRVFRYFFFQDDFTSLWIAREGPATFWRILSSFVYFRATEAVFGLNPAAFHAVSLAAHAACGVLVFLVARALSAGRAASLLAACLFVAHPSLYASVYAISSIGEILSCAFALAAVLYLSKASRPERPLGLLLLAALFAASLLSKETTVLFPVVVFFVYWLRGLRLKRALGPFAVLAVLAAAYAYVFYTANVFGVREAPAEGEPYVLTVGPALVTSLQTYFKWTLNFLEPLRRHPMNVLDEKASVWLLAGAVLFVLMLLSRKDRKKSAFCVLWFLIMLLPVVPLTGHPYHYYLYLPLAGLCPGIGLLVYRALERTRLDAAVSAALVALFVFNSFILVSRIERATVVDSVRRKDPVFDRAIVAGNLVNDLRQVEMPERTRLVLVSPLRPIQEGKIAEHPYLVMGGPYWDTNLRTAVADGVGIRLFFPQVDTVAFATETGPQFEGFTAVGYTWDGRVRTVERLPLAPGPSAP
ncbi:MAG: glycosyltransferase family 39 protein [Candidatus Eisenbacteria bacterium]|nr:glycosyltransferase family 39 protein [Candidatus Eisenbacteria bacterium]